MTKEERIERLEKELAELKEEIAAEKMKKGPRKPEHLDAYYMISDAGHVVESFWDDCSIDNKRLGLDNIFRSEEEAWRTKHRLTARKKFLDHGGHEGNDGAYKQYMEIGFFWIASPMSTGTGINPVIASAQPAIGIWFETVKDCQRAIDSLTDDEKAALCWIGEQ